MAFLKNPPALAKFHETCMPQIRGEFAASAYLGLREYVHAAWRLHLVRLNCE